MAQQTKDDPIAEFVASIPPIQSAVSLGGDGSGRIKLDVPESDMAEVLKLIAFGRDRALLCKVYAG